MICPLLSGWGTTELRRLDVVSRRRVGAGDDGSRGDVEGAQRRAALVPRGGHWNGAVSMLRLNDLVRASPGGFELGQALSELGA